MRPWGFTALKRCEGSEPIGGGGGSPGVDAPTRPVVAPQAGDTPRLAPDLHPGTGFLLLGGRKVRCSGQGEAAFPSAPDPSRCRRACLSPTGRASWGARPAGRGGERAARATPTGPSCSTTADAPAGTADTPVPWWRDPSPRLSAFPGPLHPKPSPCPRAPHPRSISRHEPGSALPRLPGWGDRSAPSRNRQRQRGTHPNPQVPRSGVCVSVLSARRWSWHGHL